MKYIDLLLFAESLCTSRIQVSHFQPSCVTQGSSIAICPSFIGSNVRDINITVLQGKNHVHTHTHAHTQHTYTCAASDMYVYIHQRATCFLFRVKSW